MSGEDEEERAARVRREKIRLAEEILRRSGDMFDDLEASRRRPDEAGLFAMEEPYPGAPTDEWERTSFRRDPWTSSTSSGFSMDAGASFLKAAIAAELERAKAEAAAREAAAKVERFRWSVLVYANAERRLEAFNQAGARLAIAPGHVGVISVEALDQHEAARAAQKKIDALFITHRLRKGAVPGRPMKIIEGVRL